MTTSVHVPVLLDRVVALVAPVLDRPGSVMVDATLGLGGHTEARGFLQDFGVVHRADRRVVGSGSSSYDVGAGLVVDEGQ